MSHLKIAPSNQSRGTTAALLLRYYYYSTIIRLVRSRDEKVKGLFSERVDTRIYFRRREYKRRARKEQRQKQKKKKENERKRGRRHLVAQDRQGLSSAPRIRARISAMRP